MSVQMTGFQPRTQPGIVDLRLTAPEIRAEAALDLQMIQLQLDHGDILRKIAPDIVRAYMQSGNSTTLALRFDHHTYLPYNVR